MSPLRRIVVMASALLISTTFSGCALREVNSFTERGVDFTRYHTYCLANDHPRVTGDARLDNNPFLEARVRLNIERELERRGFARAAPDVADLVVHYYVSVEQRLESNRVDANCDACQAQAFAYDAGTLTIDIDDARTNGLIWRGWAEGIVDGVIDNQSWLEQTLDEAVKRIFARFSPSDATS